MKALVIGSGGLIGKRLLESLNAAGWETVATSRENFDLINPPPVLPADVVYICAAITTFLACEIDPKAYRVNVDAPLNIAKAYPDARIVYLSSETVDRALHTNYGLMKALAEMGLRTACDPIIIRLSRVTPENVGACCSFLVSLADKQSGVYHWP